MSRIGVKTIVIPDSVTVSIDKGRITVKGPKGELQLAIHPSVVVEMVEKEIVVKPRNISEPKSSALWGTFRVLISNMVTGVTSGFEKKLELIGTGYKSSVSGKKLILELGYSHSIEMEAPAGIQFMAEKNIISVSGIDKQLVGEIAAQIRGKRKVEPYKGKGLRYQGEEVRRKVGKRAAGEGDK